MKVPAGKSAQVSFRIDAEELSILDREMKRTVEPGTVQILIGDSSTKTQAATLAVKP